MEIVFKKHWTMADVRKILAINFTILTVLMGVSFYFKKSPVDWIAPETPEKPPKFLYNLYGPLNQGFKRPMAVTAFDGRIFVSDTFNARVVVFDQDGRYQFAFGKPGYGLTDFLFPYGLAGDGKDNLYVADMKKGAIMVFDGKGNFINLFAENDPEEKIIMNPAGLFLDKDKLYVTDLGKDAVLVFDLQGKLLQTIGRPGKGEGQLRAPNAVTVKDKKVYVSDSANDRVVVFDESGKFLGYVGVNESGKSVFINPRGVGFHGDVLLVVNNIASRAHAFDQKSKELYSFGEMGPEDGNFGFPNGLFVDDLGRIYVTDITNGRVVVYQG